jgi:hypothetical protein
MPSREVWFIFGERHWLQVELIALAAENHVCTWRSKMKNRSVSLLGLVLLAASLVACHNKSEEDLPVSMPSAIGLNGAGATFPHPI